MVRHLLRRAEYPMLIETDTVVVGAYNDTQFNKIINIHSFGNKPAYQVIDATGEGWSFYPEGNIISPLTLNKRWTKKKIIDLYNEPIQQEESRNPYTTKSLSNKKLQHIIEEIAILAGKP